MNVPSVIDTMIEADLIEPSPDGDHYRMAPSFVSSIERYQTEIDDLGTDLSADALADRFGLEGVVPPAVETVDPPVLAEYCAVMDAMDWQADGVAVFAVLDQFRQSPPPTDGSPASALPVHADRLPLLLQCYDAAIVYVWRRDCDPCDLIRDDFDAIFESPPADLLFVSVYGPDWARFLEETYDVVGGPTILFVHDGEVDSRLIGSPRRTVIEREVETLRTLSGHEPET